MADRFEDLRTFITIVSTGGINAAASELGIAKSAVSRRLSDLEKRLGVALVERSSRRLETTAVGAEYARRARAILATLDELDASPGSGLTSRKITIGASGEIIRHVLTPAIAASASLRTAEVSLRLRSDVGDEADLLIRPSEPRSTGRRLLSTELVICACPRYLDKHGHPDEPRALDAHGAIATGDVPVEWLLGSLRRPASKIAIVTSDLDAAAAAAVAGLGICQVPKFVAAAALADGRLIHLLPEQTPQPLTFDVVAADAAGQDAARIVDALVDAVADGAHGHRRGR